ncbi:MAG TPA: DsbA family protein [Solirubrobacteraceae bacterium]|nr:DsbA family protein [Solirubrobacteraceae bacterium]
MDVDAAFYFDLANPAAYLVAERILHELPGPVEWRPVLARGLGGEPARETRSSIEHQASELGLQPVRWPEPFPFDSERAMLAATYAKSIGRAVPFAQAAFRQAFAGGRDLGELDSILIAAAACEMHPQAVLRGVELRSVREQLAAATRAAAAAGVRAVPAVRIGEQVLGGPRMLADARRALQVSVELGDQKNAKSNPRDRADGHDDPRDRADQKMDFSHRPCAPPRESHGSADREHAPCGRTAPTA